MTYPHNTPDLSGLDEAWDSTEAADVDSILPPAGSYTWQVERVHLDTWPSGDPYLQWTLHILEGPDGWQGRTDRKRSNINRKAMPYLKADLRLCGVQLERLSSLPDRLGDLLDLKIKGKVQFRGQRPDGSKYRNVYFNDLVRGDKRPAAKHTRQTIDPEDIPF